MRVLATFLLLFSVSACSHTQASGRSSALAVGDAAPKLSATDQNGASVSTQPATGFTLVYFYPKDGTPGCTKEACAFRDVWDRYEHAGVRVIGVSSDDAESHRKFAKEHQLPFSLVADESHKWADAFGVGTFVGMTKRVSFLIDAQGRIAQVYPSVDPGVHAAQVLADVARVRK